MSKISDEDLELWHKTVKGVKKVSAKAKVLPENKKSKIINHKSEIVLKPRLDLHEMTLVEAHSATVLFIEQAYNAGFKTVRIISGKSGQIARELPFWLKLLPHVRRLAHPEEKFGGAGAYDVLLNS